MLEFNFYMILHLSWRWLNGEVGNDRINVVLIATTKQYTVTLNKENLKISRHYDICSDRVHLPLRSIKTKKKTLKYPQ